MRGWLGEERIPLFVDGMVRIGRGSLMLELIGIVLAIDGLIVILCPA